MSTAAFYAAGLKNAEEKVNEPAPLLPTVNPAAAPKGITGKQITQKGKSILDDVGHIAAGAAKSAVALPVGLAKDTNKELISPAIHQAEEIVKTPSILIKGSPQEHQQNAINSEYAANVKAGKVSPVVDATVKSNYDPQTMKTIVNTAVAKGATDSDTQQALSGKLAEQSATTNRIAAEAAGTASLGVGGGEVADAGITAAKGAEDLAEEETPSVATKVAGAVKGSAKLGTSGAVGNAAETEQQNPNATPKQIAESAGEGYAGALAFGAAGKVIGKTIGGIGAKIFGKAPPEDAPIEAAPKSIPVKDESTGAVTGKVSNVLPKAPGGIPIQGPRPSDDGYTDFDMRSQFNAPAAQVTKTVPQVMAAAQKTGSNDPLTVTMQTLADTKSKTTTGKIVDTLLPDLGARDRNGLVRNLQANNDPTEAANLVWDAAKNHEAQSEKLNSMVGTPMDKQISFQGAGTAENAQRASLHSRVGQINSQLEAHNSGARPLNQAAVDRLTAERQTSQDVLDGKKDFATTFPDRVATVGRAAADVKALPFGDQVPAENPQLPTPATSGAADRMQARINGTPDVPTVQPKTGQVIADLPQVPKGDMTRQAVVNRKAAIADTADTYHEKQAGVLFKALSKNPSDVKLLEKIETPTQMTAKAADDRMVRIAQGAKNPKVFIAYARLLRQDYDTMLAHRTAIHPETAQISNYFPHIFDRTDGKTAEFLKAADNMRARIANSDKAPGYTQHRIIPSYAKADELGLKRANPNMHEDYLQAIHQSAQENGKAALIKGLGEAHGIGSIANKVGFDANTGQHFDALQIPGGKGLTMPQKLADFYNQRAPSKLSQTAPEDRTATQTARAGYKSVNKGGKNVVLAGGLFHGLRTAITTSGQQLFNFKNNLTHPIQAIGDNLRLIAETASSTVHNAHLRQLATDNATNIDKRSTLQRARLSGLSYTSKEIQGDLAGKGNESGINRIPGLKQAHSAVFDRQIPAAKMMMFKQATRNMSVDNPDDLVKMRQIAAGINRGLGGIDNAVQGLSPKMASAVDNVILGRDLNEGIVATLGHSVKPNATDGRIARQFVAGSAVVSALPGLVTLIAQGKLNPQNLPALEKAFVAQLEDPQIPTPWRNPPSESNPKGTPISLKMPTTFASLLSKVIQPALDPMSTYSGSRVSGLETEASGRLAFLPALGEKLGTNQDFYGDKIYGPGISGKQTGINVAEQVAPIPAGQISRAASGQESAAEAGLNELGLRGSTSTLPSSNLTHSQAINDYYNTTTALKRSQTSMLAQKDILLKEGKTNQATRLVQQWNTKTLPSIVQPFRTKYAANYNPAWDQGFLSYTKSTSKYSTQESQKDLAKTQAIENPNYKREQ